MAAGNFTLGIVGGSGMLGKTIAGAVLEKKVVAPRNFWISNRSGTAGAFEHFADVNVTTDNQKLVDACDVVVLSVPPASVPELEIDARERLIVSVMAGVPLEKLGDVTGAKRAVRAMSSPAAGAGLAYSPWCASSDVTGEDRERVTAIFEACGTTDEVGDEAQIDIFTAMTGPVPGFVAFFAKAMADYAENRGIAADVADRAIRQLFLGAGVMMSEGAATPADHVREMIDYAGTTAAGLAVMERSSIAEQIAEALDASVARTRTIG